MVRPSQHHFITVLTVKGYGKKIGTPYSGLTDVTAYKVLQVSVLLKKK